MEAEAFLQRVLKRADPRVHDFQFQHWNHAGRPTDEAFGILKVPGADPKKVIDAVMDVDHYLGNIPSVGVSRSKADARFALPDQVRFYQKIDIPVLGSLHHELVLKRLGEHNGFLCAGWDLLRQETDALNPKEGARSDYNHGLWIAAPGVVGYALGSAPKRDDVGLLKWKAMTSGADVAAPKVVRTNIESMAKWAARRR